MNRYKFLSAGFLFVVAVAAGYFAGARSWNGVIYLTDGSIMSNSRSPAAIKRELDFSRLDGVELITATQKRLVLAARAVASEGKVGVELGHFVTRDEEGKRRLACDSFYDRMTLQFEGEGSASAGEKPTMEIDGPCNTSSREISSIEPIWIPVNEIFKEKATSQELTFEEGVTYRFDHVMGAWPVRWSLQSVRLYNSSDDLRNVTITRKELRELRPKPIVLNFLDGRRPASKH